MSLAPQRSRSWGGSSGDFEFGWGEGGGPPPVAGIEPGAKHDASATNFSPALIAMFIVLGSAFLVVSYYKIFYKFCKPCRRRPRRRGFESEDQLQDYSPGGLIFQDTDGWQLFSSNNYGLDESIIKSIPVCIFKREDKFIDGVECSVCLLEFKEKETLRVLPKCSHAFHVSCIDVWLRSHANCPLCRASVVVNIQSPFVPAMAGRIRPNLDHGMAGVVHDSFRSEQEAAVAEAAVNSRTTSDLQHVTDSQRDADVCIDLEGPEVVADVNLEDSSENFLNSKPVLARSYSFSCSGNEHYNRDSTVNTEFPLDALLLTENSAASPWKKAFKRFNSPFNSKGGGLFSLKSPFFNRNRRGSASSSSTNNFSSMLMFPLSPARDHYTRRSARDFRHSGGSTRIRGGSLSPPFFRVQQGRAQSMTSPLFLKRSSFSVFTSSRARTGDPEALLSPHRFNSQRE